MDWSLPVYIADILHFFKSEIPGYFAGMSNDAFPTQSAK